MRWFGIQIGEDEEEEEERIWDLDRIQRLIRGRRRLHSECRTGLAKTKLAVIFSHFELNCGVNFGQMTNNGRILNKIILVNYVEIFCLFVEKLSILT